MMQKRKWQSLEQVAYETCAFETTATEYPIEKDQKQKGAKANVREVV